VKRSAIVLVLAALAAGTASSASTGPSIAFAPAVPGDVRALAGSAWGRFTSALPGARGCLAPVRVTVAWTLRDRAIYQPEARTVIVRVPGTAPNLTASLLHEFAHHLEFTCDRISRLRPAFLAAQGFQRGTRWFRGPTWEATPSEQYAEAVAQLVMGHPPAHQRVVLRDRAMEAIRAWARGP
jgi:hypothetical protein